MDTKNVKRKIDDDTVDRLVENRVPKKNAQRKAKKKKKAGLSILITALAAVLVFVVFFVGSYIFFTSGSSENDIEELPSFEDVVKEDNETEENKEIIDNEDNYLNNNRRNQKPAPQIILALSYCHFL